MMMSRILKCLPCGQPVAVGIDPVSLAFEGEGDVVADVLLVLDHCDAFSHVPSLAHHWCECN